MAKNMSEVDSQLIDGESETAFSSAFLAIPSESDTKPLDIPQGEVIRNIQRGTLVKAVINPGACVLGIIQQTNEETSNFTAGHFTAGEIVRELQALAKMGDGSVSIFQGTIEGEIVELYSNGQRLTPKGIRAKYRARDIHHLTNMT